MFRCPTDSTGQCNDNAEVFVEHMHCERFQNDINGPWFMISNAMTGSKCGEMKVHFCVEQIIKYDCIAINSFAYSTRRRANLNWIMLV